MLASGATPRYCVVALPPWSVGPGHRAVAGDQAVDERAVAAVVVHAPLPVDEVDESDDPRLSVDAVQVGHVGAAAVEDRDSYAGAVEAALGRRRDGAETDGGVGDVETVCVVGAEGGHVGGDVVDVGQRGTSPSVSEVTSAETAPISVSESSIVAGSISAVRSPRWPGLA